MVSKWNRFKLAADQRNLERALDQVDQVTSNNKYMIVVGRVTL